MLEITTARAGVDDLPVVASLAVDNDMFGPDDADGFVADLADHLTAGSDEHLVLVARAGDRTVGAAYVAAEPFSDRVWNLLFIATAPDAHGSGAGTALVSAVQGELVAADLVATLVVDTSSTDGYAAARRFYLGLGFVEEARVRDWYGPGDDKVTYWKSFRLT